MLLKILKKILGVLWMIIGVLGGLYIGVWLMFVTPIINIAQMIDLHTLTTTGVVVEILKILFASPVGWIVGWLGITFGMMLFLHD